MPFPVTKSLVSFWWLKEEAKSSARRCTGVKFPEENADSVLLGASGKPSRLGAAVHDEIFQKLEADSVACDLVGKPSQRFMQELQETDFLCIFGQLLDFLEPKSFLMGTTV